MSKLKLLWWRLRGQFGHIRISRQEVVDVLYQYNKEKSVRVKAETAPRLKKSCPYKDNITKVALIRGRINPSDLDTSPHDRAWGERPNKSPIVSYQGNFYVTVRIDERSETYISRVGSVVYSKQQIEPYLISKNQEPLLRDYSLNSIKELQIGNTVFLVES